MAATTSSVTLQIAREGLTVLPTNLNLDDAGDPNVDIIFLHGLNGHPENTWKNSSGFYWPAQLCKDISKARVMVFGYNADFERALVENKTSIEAIAKSLVNRLIDQRQGEAATRPVVLIAHSLGGLVVKRALVLMHRDRNSGRETSQIREQNALYDSVAGIIFMGTPHAGSRVADMARVKLLKAIAKATLKRPPEKIIKALASHSDELQHLSDDFEHTTTFAKHEIEMCTFYETITTKFLGEEVVPLSMSKLHYLNEHEEPIHASHTEMVKFKGPDDAMYRSIARRLGRMRDDWYKTRVVPPEPAGINVTYRVRGIPLNVTKQQLPIFLCAIEPKLGPPANIQVHSLCLPFGVWERPQAQTATITLKKMPAMLKNTDELSFTKLGPTIQGKLSIDTHFRGFTVLNNIPEEDHRIDCIALSGPGSHPFSSWEDTNSQNHFMWLRDSLPELCKGVRVITFGPELKNEERFAISSSAEALIWQLRQIGQTSLSAKPLIFIAHGLSGVILKHSLMLMGNSGDREEYILEAVVGVLFIAVPCRPLKKDIVQLMSPNLNFNTAELKNLYDSDYLLNLDSRFCGVATIRGIRLFSMYENVPTDISKKIQATSFYESNAILLVEKATATQQGTRDGDLCPLHGTHHGVIKLNGSSQDISTIASMINDTLGDSVGYNGSIPKAPTHLRSNTMQRNLSAAHSPWSRMKGYFDWTKSIASTVGLSTRSLTSHAQPIVSETRQSSDLLNTKNISDIVITLEKMLDSLYITELENREAQIEQAYQGTFQWIWSSTGFVDWLGNDKTLFWINGKPGSGKSTLMKYIQQHPQTLKAINPKDRTFITITARFFFHNRGSHSQKSFEGLLRSILHLIFSSEERLAQDTLMRFQKSVKHDKSYWTLNELKLAFTDILSQKLLSVRIFLFLDALDEFDGPPELIAEFIKSITSAFHDSSTQIKVCFSSREWNVFKDCFSKESGFKIHDFTQPDISRYIHVRLSEARYIDTILSTGNAGQDEVKKIQSQLENKAHGVFIWVRAVLDDILANLEEDLSLSALNKKISSFPEDLDVFYRQVVDRIPRDFRLESYVMFETLLRHEGPIKLRMFAEVVTCALHNGLEESAQALSVHSFDEDEFKRRLSSHTGGLIEVNETDVQFMHQTVKDFVAWPGFSDTLVRDASDLREENGYTFLSKYEISNEVFLWRSRLRYFPAVSHYVDIRVWNTFKSEQTTGRSLSSYWNCVRVEMLQISTISLRNENFFSAHYIPMQDASTGDIKLCVAAIGGWLLYSQELVHRQNRIHHGPGAKLPLHYLAESLPISLDIGEAFVNQIEILRLLIRAGYEPKATFNSKNTLQILVGSWLERGDELYLPDNLTLFITCLLDTENTCSIPDLVSDTLFENPKSRWIFSEWLALLRQPPAFKFTLMHLARPTLLKWLLGYGVAVGTFSTLNGVKLTALDMCYRYFFRPNAALLYSEGAEAYELATMLLENGACIMSASDFNVKMFCDNLMACGIESIPKNMRNPPKLKGYHRLRFQRKIGWAKN